jgi:CRISPR-associated protein Cas2
MLRLMACDIADPKRLRRVPFAGEDFGLRVQKSLVECGLEEDRFSALWSRLTELIDPAEDCLAACVLDAASSPRRRAAGRQIFTERRTQLVF